MAKDVMYLLQVNLCLVVFYFLYVLCFKNTTFFKVNRFYLLAGLIFSFAIPQLNFELVEYDYHMPAINIIDAYFVSQPSAIHSSQTLTPSYNYAMLIYAIYFLGVIVMLWRLINSCKRIIQIQNSGEIEMFGEFKIVRTDLVHPFSFFNLVFLPKTEVNPLIVDHEKVHINQHHWIDLLLLEIVRIILWFNPIMLLYKRAIKMQHEYLADAASIKDDTYTEQYLDCMLHQIRVENNIELINQFYSKSLKQRITMITKNKTSINFSAVYLLIIPVICVLLFAFSNKPDPMLSSLNVESSSKDQFVIIVDAGHGGQDLGVHSESMNEKELTISFAKTIQKIGEAKGVKVILTRKGDEAMSLQNRALYAQQFSAKLFISIHANYDEHDPAKSGMECVLSEGNIKFEDSKAFGSQVVNELKTIDGISVSGIKTSGALVLKNNTVPAVILELGYLSNTSDAKFLSDEHNQQRIAESVISSVIKFLK